MSGSTDAGDIAELRKLQAERAELQEGLDDTYYNHSKDSQSKALDDEMEAFQESMDDFIESLREGLEDTEKIFEKLVTEVGLNADLVLEGINEVAEENGVPLSLSLTDPWSAAAGAAILFKESASTTLKDMIGEGGVITLFSSTAFDLLKEPFESMTTAKTGPLASFESGVGATFTNIKSLVNGEGGYASSVGAGLAKPWNDTTAEDGPIDTFNEKVKNAINKAKTKVTGENGNQNYLGDAVAKPWKDGSNAAYTFADDVGKALDQAIATTTEKMKKLNDASSTYSPSYTGNNNNTNNNSANNNNSVSYSPALIKLLQGALNTIFNSGLDVDGKWGSKTKAALKKAQQIMVNAGVAGAVVNGAFEGNATLSMIASYGTYLMQVLRKQNGSSMIGQGIQSISGVVNNIRNVLGFAKGTMGTTRDQWAITDEPQFGDELVLMPTAQGNLSYMRKGTSVVPADITANLVEWGQLNPDMLTMGNVGANLNMISNAVVQPSYEFTFDSLVHVDHCDEGTLKNLEKMVDTKINDFSKQLNYSIKKFAR